jgi:hypothetical protein
MGLPNNPDYTLGPLAGSPCDTLAIGVEELQEEIVRIMPNPATTEIKLESSSGNIRDGTLYRINDITGRTKLTGYLLGRNLYNKCPVLSPRSLSVGNVLRKG